MLDTSLQQLVFQCHLFATFFMTGLIWFVQVVHYPFLHFIPAEDGGAAFRFHQHRTGWVVLPVMVVEILTGILLLSSSWMMLFSGYLWMNLALLLVIWGVTFLKLVPLHKRLLTAAGGGLINVLVATNWIRTLLWTIRSLLLLRFLS